MDAGLLVRLHPAGPWRFGASSGERDRLDRLYRSDALYSAVTLAMAELGLLEAWLEATAAPAAPQVRLTSCFPWQEEILFVTPPRSHWPAAAVKLRTKGADFIPASLAGALLEGAPFHEDDWIVDGWSRCLLPAARPASAGGPFRDSLRSFAAVDRRDPARIAPHRAACIEFAPNAGLWCFAAFSDPEAQTRWSVPLEGAFRLLADSGIGGRRSIGWGRAVAVEIAPKTLEELLFGSLRPPERTEGTAGEITTLYWLLSLYTPAPQDAVDWTQGAYSVVTRGGRAESRITAPAPKRLLRMVEEGSVIAAASPPAGMASDVSPDGFPHPVYRYGRPVAWPIGRRIAA
jgi:CRISPR type III-A-associated RAMP protein Csm4